MFLLNHINSLKPDKLVFIYVLACLETVKVVSSCLYSGGILQLAY